MSASEPLRTYRKVLRRCQNQGSVEPLGEVCGGPEFGAGGNRYIGGMTLRQAFPWNVRTCALDEKGNRQVADTASGNTEARDRGGVARSSVEASVMDVERRGDVIAWLPMTNLLRREELRAATQPFRWLDDGSRVSREAHARFCERPRGKFPRPTHQVAEDP